MPMLAVRNRLPPSCAFLNAPGAVRADCIGLTLSVSRAFVLYVSPSQGVAGTTLVVEVSEPALVW